MAGLHQQQSSVPAPTAGGLTGHALGGYPGVTFDDMSHLEVAGTRYVSLPVTQVSCTHKSGSSVAPSSPPPPIVTVFRPPNASGFTAEWLRAQVDAWTRLDDVFRVEFLAGIVVVVVVASEEEEHVVAAAIVSDLARFLPPLAWNTTWWAVVGERCSFKSQGQGGSVEPGPHVLLQVESAASGGMLELQLRKVYRIYDDVNNAFVMATRPQVTPSGSYSDLRVGGSYYTSIGVAVSSRIPSLSGAGPAGPGPVQGNPNNNNNNTPLPLPLRGVRFAVKDMFAIQGLRVTAGNRAYYSLQSSPAPTTCPALRRLLGAGAELTGTLRLGSLVAREEPSEAADYHAPFNPRGDGYQSAWSSSGGSGAAIAAYDWLDFTIAQDTTGSSRRPVMANGCFGIRLSQEAIPLVQGVVPSFPRFDAPAMYTRDIARLEAYVGTWLGQKPAAFDELPITIVYPTDFLPVPNDEQMRLVDHFVRDMAQALGAEVKNMSIAETWRANPPHDAGGQSVQEYLRDVGANTFVYDVYHTMDEFRSTYESQFNRQPYVNPVTRYRWDIAEGISLADHQAGMRRLDVYRDWLLEHVLAVDAQNALVVLPITSQAVDYRDDPVDPPSAPPDAFDGIWLAPALQAPEISVPIGELTYHSRVTKRDEKLPVAISVLSKPGSDMPLIDAIKTVLRASGRPGRVKTGSTMF